jgi:hypothetical protein
MQIIRYTLCLILLINRPTFCKADDKNKNLSITDLKFDSKINIKEPPSNSVKESIVNINNIPYRQVEYQNNFFYMKLSSPIDDLDENTGECLRRPQGPAPERIQFVYGKNEEKKRSRFFIESLSIKCGEQLNWKDFMSKLKDIKIGLSIPDQKGDKFKDKKIYFALLQNSLNVQGSF